MGLELLIILLNASTVRPFKNSDSVGSVALELSVVLLSPVVLKIVFDVGVTVPMGVVLITCSVLLVINAVLLGVNAVVLGINGVLIGINVVLGTLVVTNATSSLLVGAGVVLLGEAVLTNFVVVGMVVPRVLPTVLGIFEVLIAGAGVVRGASVPGSEVVLVLVTGSKDNALASNTGTVFCSTYKIKNMDGISEIS